ncbi:MAG: DUF2723 domain-containing protein [Saprospiraceae bacterium]|nr:DUF2723 domain-containing protein [Saprospiraceae bacterium]
MTINSLKKAKTIASWLVFFIAIVVYYFSVERTGSLWDVGEFILGAYKLEVVHPPGAPLFMLVGRMFSWIADLVSNNPANIAFAVNFMSALCTAFGAFLLARITILLGKLALVGREGETTGTQNLALTFAGTAAGLSMAFCSSIWFSAVEGEVYAMSTMFTVLTLWAGTKWFSMPDSPKADRWLILTIYIVGLSLGVHLLSLLTLPAIGIMYYIKKYEKHTLFGYALSFLGGAAIIVFVQKFIIVGIPTLWKNLEIPMVNSFGMPFHSGLVLALLLVGALIFYLLKMANTKRNNILQLLVVGALMLIVGFSTIGVIIIRANADTPVNMNVPSDATRVIPYLNREQYGERALLFGPHFNAQPEGLEKEDRYGIVGDKYEVVDQRLEYKYRARDKMFFPRVGHTEGPRPGLHKQWHKAIMGKEVGNRPGFGYNIKFLLNYQMGWMYWRYFMWNFVGKQNAQQGFMPWDVKSGHWASGIKPIDEMRLHNMDELTDTMKNHKGTNHYYFLPLIFGLLGMFFHFSRDKKTFLSIFALFFLTGLGLILYSNQPPNEPRERDYVLVGSFFTFCIWIGMAVLFLSENFIKKLKLSGKISPIIAGVMVLLAPLLMATQNFDDHSRMTHYASRDYASNFLNSVEKDAIIFTYGDNDTYPLWYAQEVENIRRDVRVVNLSLIFVDWYIEKLRRKVNDSPPLKLTIPSESYRGNKRHQVFFYNPSNQENLSSPIDINTELQFVGSPQNSVRGQSFARSRNLYIPINKQKLLDKGLMPQKDTANMVDNILLRFSNNKQYISKDELAVIDVVASNLHDRPIYFAVTCKNDKLLGLNDYMQMEGLGLRIVPVKTPSIRSLSIYGSGRVQEDKVYENIMTKWRWGNFDKHETFVDNSYAAEIQAMKIIMMRTSQEFLGNNNKQKAGDLAAKYFEAFPHFNFPYDESVVPFINVLIKSDRREEAKKHLKILAEETRQKLKFYDSLAEDDFESFKSDYSYAIRAVSEVLDNARLLNDPELLAKLEKDLSEYDITKMKN